LKIVLDDLKARLAARDKDLSVTGTVGVLIEAKERGFIPSLRPEIDRLIEARMWVSEVFYHRILKEYGEYRDNYLSGARQACPAMICLCAFAICV